jgi:hypothetical protein
MNNYTFSRIKVERQRLCRAGRLYHTHLFPYVFIERAYFGFPYFITIS